VEKNLKFQSLYKNLNQAQKEAVDTIEGPVMVIAGPGTGKTTILTLRIANILRQTDTPPEAILALTFTESGAYNMRRKLVEIMGPAGYKVNIQTFHGFCNDLIKNYPERFPRIISSTIISDIDQIKLMEEIITSAKLKLLRPFGDPFYYVRPSLSIIKTLKREGYESEDLLQKIDLEETSLRSAEDFRHQSGAHKGKIKGDYLKRLEQLEKNKELAEVFKNYSKFLEKRSVYDYEDMILEVVRVFDKDQDFLLIVQESFQYILADEHQDANNAQNKVLELLSNFHQNPNLFIVGDDKQAIFRFQGASLENFLYFSKLYPKAKLIQLTDNYRSQQDILDASHSMIGKGRESSIAGLTRARLKAKSSHAKCPIKIIQATDTEAEHHLVANEIARLIKAGTAPEQIAILYRENREATPVSVVLSRYGLPHHIESDQDLLRDEEIRKLIILFKAITDLSDNEAIGKALLLDFLKLEPVEAFELMFSAYKNRLKLSDAIKKQLPELWQKLSHFASLGANKPLTEAFEIIVRESGFLESMLKSGNSLDRLTALEGFFAEIKRLAKGSGEYLLKDFIDYIDLIKDHGILLKNSAGGPVGNGIRLMTAHKSKGLEFDYVFIVGAIDGTWGNKKNRTLFHLPTLIASKDSKDDIDDERRLFYVALTRARMAVSVSYYSKGDDGKERLPSQFISEIDNKFLSIDDNTSQKTKTKGEIEGFSQRQFSQRLLTNIDYIEELFLRQGLSVTALNNYLKCPWQYFFVNLIRLPQSPSKHQAYGTAVHETLKIFFNKYREDADISKKELLELFGYYLTKQPVSQRDFDDLLAKGQKSLTGYYDKYKGSWPRHLVTEFSVRGVHLPVKIKEKQMEIVLNGQLDKLEFETDTKVKVVDYKTGKPQSRNKILGNTKGADLNYYRQLIFYKLILELSDKDKYQMNQGVLEFTEPDDSLNYHREVFEISDKEVSDLRVVISKTAQEIISGEFLNQTCEDSKCEYCELAKLLKR